MTAHLTATDLDEWSRRRDSQGHLPTLVRRLIMASVRPDRIRVPAAEGVALPGLDGIVTVAGGAPPYVPAGDSAWEMGTDQNPKTKATRDYKKRAKQTPAHVRANTTFVFVTSRTWNQSDAWVRAAKKLGDGWKDIVVLDGQDLATWLESCPGVHAWLVEHLGRGSLGVSGLVDWFTQWSQQTSPATPASVPVAGRRDDAVQLLEGLTGHPRSIELSAGSVDEAVAFVASALQLGPGPAPKETEADAEEAAADQVQPTAASDATQGRQYEPSEREALLARCIVVEDIDGWRRWSSHETPHILLPLSAPDSVQAALMAGHHVVLPRVARDAQSGGRLAPIDIHAARASWEAAGVDFHRAAELARSSRRNLGSLRRRISRHGRLREPVWAGGTSASLLAAVLLAGAWDAGHKGDVEVLLDLAERTTWRGLARDLVTLTVGEDAPLAELDQRWDFVDVIDAWDAVGGYVTAEDIEVFAKHVPTVLTEPDPARGLSESERMAMLLDPDRPRHRYSGTLRHGVATTLAILGSVIGDRAIAGGRTGQDVASRIVRDLLKDADAERWLVLVAVIPLLAEAAPQVFLDALEQSLRAEDPPVMALFEESTDAFGQSRSNHSPLLWALETLGFSSALVSRVAVTLARLVALDPGGRLSNRPPESLNALLHLRVPQGVIDETTRLDVLDAIRRSVPEAATDVMVSLVKGINSGMLIRTGPRYRDWPTRRTRSTPAVVDRAVDEIGDRLLADVSGDGWVKVAGLVGQVTPASRAKIVTALSKSWETLNQGAQTGVLETVTKVADRHRRFPKAAWAMTPEDLADLDRFLTDHGEPPSPRSESALFAWWPNDIDLTTEEGKAELARRRTAVVTEAVGASLEGIVELAKSAKLPYAVGDTLAAITGDLDDDVLDLLDSTDWHEQQMAFGLAQARSRTPGWLSEQIGRRPTQAGWLLLAADLNAATLDLVETLGAHQQAVFWSKVVPYRASADIVDRFSDGLIGADRPFSAIAAVESQNNPSAAMDLVLKVLRAPMAGTSEDVRVLRSPDYLVGRLLNQLEQAGAAEDDLAQLELFYLPLLSHERPPTALHRKLANDPVFFAEVVCGVYKPDDVDEPEESEAADATTADGDTQADEPEEHGFIEGCWHLLRGWRDPLPGATPGSAPDPQRLRTWVREARQALAAKRRASAASLAIGEALAGPAADEDGIWPCLAVREVLEHEQDATLEESLMVTRINRRGVTVRGVYDGGKQERTAAAKYRTWADVVRDRWPRSGALLDQIAASYEADGRREDHNAERQARG